MDSKRTRRFLIVAFALSLLIHLIVTGLVRWPLRPQNKTEQVVHVVQLSVVHATPRPRTPPPVPTPPTLPTHPPAVRHTVLHVAKAEAISAHTHARESRVVRATPEPTATPAATPSPTPVPACMGSDTPVHVIASAPPPQIAPDARAGRVSGTAQIRVVVNAAGAVENANVVSSSGSPALDLVALGMAKSAEYQPATHLCKAIAAAYTYSVRFIAY